MADTSDRKLPLSNKSNQIIVLTFLLLAFILLNSTNRIEQTTLPIWKNNALYSNLFFKDEVPEEYREYHTFSASVINGSFPYIRETSVSSPDTAWATIGDLDFLALKLKKAIRGKDIMYLYSESFGLYNILSKNNESIDGYTISRLTAASYVEVHGYRFVVYSGGEKYFIFCIKNIDAVVDSIETSVGVLDVVIKESNYNVSGLDAIEAVLQMRYFEKIYRIEARTRSGGELENGTMIDAKVWLLSIFVSPPKGLSGSIVRALVDVNTGKVYDITMWTWVTDT